MQYVTLDWILAIFKNVTKDINRIIGEILIKSVDKSIATKWKFQIFITSLLLFKWMSLFLWHTHFSI